MLVASNEQQEPWTLADASGDLRRILEEEGVTFQSTERSDRPNPFTEALADPERQTDGPRARS